MLKKLPLDKINSVLNKQNNRYISLIELRNIHQKNTGVNLKKGKITHSKS